MDIAPIGYAVIAVLATGAAIGLVRQQLRLWGFRRATTARLMTLARDPEPFQRTKDQRTKGEIEGARLLRRVKAAEWYATPTVAENATRPCLFCGLHVGLDARLDRDGEPVCPGCWDERLR